MISSDQYVTSARDDSQQLHLYQAWKAPLQGTSEYYAMTVMNNILGGAGLSSRLFTEIRDKQGLAYNVRSMIEPSKYVSAFIMYVGTEPKNRERVIAGFKTECERLMNTPLTQQEIEAGKRNILGRHVILLERAPQQAAYFGAKLALGVSIEELQSYRQRIEAVTIADVQAVAQKYLSQNSIISAVGPSKNL